MRICHVIQHFVPFGGIEALVGEFAAKDPSHHVVVLEGTAQGGAQRVYVVAERAEEAGVAADLAHGIRQDAPVAVVDEARPHGFAGLYDLIAGGEDGNPRPAHDRHPVAPDRRQHAGLPGAQLRTREEHRLAPAHVRARERDRGAGRARLASSPSFSIHVSSAAMALST